MPFLLFQKPRGLRFAGSMLRHANLHHLADKVCPAQTKVVAMVVNFCRLLCNEQSFQ